MYSREYRENDYNTLAQWWSDWGWPSVPTQHLPQNGLVVCDDDDNPLCAVFIYKTDSVICWVENFISSKNIISRNEAIELLIDSAVERAEELGFSMILTVTNHNGLNRRLSQNGFVEVDRELVNMAKVISNG